MRVLLLGFPERMFPFSISSGLGLDDLPTAAALLVAFEMHWSDIPQPLDIRITFSRTPIECSEHPGIAVAYFDGGSFSETLGIARWLLRLRVPRVPRRGG